MKFKELRYLLVPVVLGPLVPVAIIIGAVLGFFLGAIGGAYVILGVIFAEDELQSTTGEKNGRS